MEFFGLSTLYLPTSFFQHSLWTPRFHDWWEDFLKYKFKLVAWSNFYYYGKTSRGKAKKITLHTTFFLLFQVLQGRMSGQSKIKWIAIIVCVDKYSDVTNYFLRPCFENQIHIYWHLIIKTMVLSKRGIQQLSGPNLTQCWPPTPIEWTIADISYTTLFTYDQAWTF